MYNMFDTSSFCFILYIIFMSYMLILIYESDIIQYMQVLHE